MIGRENSGSEGDCCGDSLCPSWGDYRSYVCAFSFHPSFLLLRSNLDCNDADDRMLLIMFLMYTTAHLMIRKQCFEAFWYTHHLVRLPLFHHTIIDTR
jgi:hypothetical protein